MVLLQALFLARLMSYWRFYWCTGFFLLVRFFFSVFFGGYFLCLVMLLLGLVSAESHPEVQLIRAELSSKSSSERLPESPSKLSTHQIPRCLGSGGPPQLKSCTRTSTLFLPTTPSGASVLSAFFSHSALHFDFGVEQACFAAARVLLTCSSRASPSSASSCLAFLPYEAFPHAEVRCQRIHAFCGSAFPSSGPTSSFLSSSMRVQYLLGGGRTCFPDRDCRRRPESHCISHRSCLPVPRSLCLPERPDEFSRSRLCTSSSPLLHSTIHSFTTKSSCASVAWKSTVFGVAGLVTHFEARKVVQWVLAHWFVLSCIHSLEPRGLAKPPQVSPLHVSLDKGRSGLGFQRNLELAFSNLSAPAVPREKASRPPAVVDSLAALAFNEAALRPPAVVDSTGAQEVGPGGRCGDCVRSTP